MNAQLRPEPRWYLWGLSYAEYLRTDHWKLRRWAYREGKDGRCERCGLATIDGVRPPKFHVHHLSYERLGHEHDDDLELLCAPCHNLAHRPHSHSARWWAGQPRVSEEAA